MYTANCQTENVYLIFQNLRNKKYHAREQFLVDVNQIVENCRLYNGMLNCIMEYNGISDNTRFCVFYMIF